jgi:CTP synthase (UTP-ammonia lyase)
LAGKRQTILITPGTRIHRIYGKTEVDEAFQCSYGLNETYRSALVDKGLHIAGVDPQGAARIVELPDHRFFMATLFLPQLSSTPETPHPLFMAFLHAAMAFRDDKPSAA